MRKHFFAGLFLMGLCLSLFGCGSSEGKTIIQNGSGTTVISGGTETTDGIATEVYQTAASEKQRFYTKCLNSFDVVWDDEDGLYIYIERSGSIPYVLLYRFADMPISAEQFLDEVIEPDMRETYGDDLVEVGARQDYDIGGKSLPGILFTYKVDGHTVQSLRLCQQEGKDIINFTAKYLEDGNVKTMNALAVAVENFALGNPGTPTPIGGSPVDEALSITRSEAAQVRYETYSDPGGYFTMDIPRGWAVSVGLIPGGEVDLISYAIRAYDPANADRILYFNLNCAAGLKSQAARDWYATYYGASNDFARLPVLPEVSTLGFFQGMAGYYYYSGFNLLENLGTSALGGDVLVANAASTLTGATLEGIFTATLEDGSYYVQRNPFDYSAGQIDAWPATAYTILMETAPQEEFLDWQPVLDHCLSTLRFTERFQSDRQAAWRQLMGTSQYIMQQADEISSMIMDSWEASSRSYDVISQKQSDATLGYERVYDTETGEYYKADAGFGDWYDGQRYTVVNDDDSYLFPVSGYIEWK